MEVIPRAPRQASDRPPPAGRLPAWALPAAILLILGAHIGTIGHDDTWHGDASQYVLHAENLVEGRPFSDTRTIKNPQRFIAPATYPPGFPLLLAPVVAASGRSRPALSAFSALFLVAGIALAVRLTRRDLTDYSALALVLAVGLNPALWRFQQSPLTDIPFVFFVLAALVAYERMETAGPRRHAFGWALAAGGLAGYALLVRTLGAVIVPTFLIAALIRHRRVPAPHALALGTSLLVPAVVLLAVDWSAGAQFAVLAADQGPGAGYSDLVRTLILERVGELPRQVVTRAVEYVRMDHAILWHPVLEQRWLALPIRLGGGLLIAVGFVRSIRRGPRPFDLFAVLYGLALLPWSFGDPRYLLPLIPFFYAYLLSGVEAAWSWGPGSLPWARVAALSIAGLLVGSYAARGVAYAVAPPFERGFVEGHALVAAGTPPDAVVLTVRDSRPMTLTTGRTGSPAPEDAEAWPAYARAVGATHAYIDSDPGRYQAWADSVGWRRIGTSEDGHLYAIPQGL